ncbi:ABC transporter permease [Paludibaculum fermentans]|uniref:ABC transporter permease n=1 Tax=Paludibaculum fermentans TaxID=1473598 RepID=UPI003EC08343
MRLYSALLRLYPKSFRLEYGAEMRAVFAARRRDAGSLLGIAGLWLETIPDVLQSAAGAHWDIARQDLRYAARTLRRAPGFTLTAVLVSALGIGATTAAFTLLDHVLLRPLPFPDQDRLVKLWENHTINGNFWDIAPANYRDWKRESKSYEGMGAYRQQAVDLVGRDDPVRLEGAAVTWEVFPLLGVQPLMGRFFQQSDDTTGAAGAVVLSYTLWQGQFGGDASVLGRKVLLDGAPYNVIGVMPRGFYVPSREALFWTAMRFEPEDFEDRENTYIYGLAKLRPGVSARQAQVELSGISGQLAREYPKELTHIGAKVLPLRDDVSNSSVLMLRTLLGAAFCVLLVACTNLANLLIARSLGRRRELAVRTAMGAGRERLVRQMLTESLLLSLAGGGLGILMGTTTLPLLARLVPNSLPIAEVPSVDLRVLGFAALLTLFTGLAFGLLPALRLSRQEDSKDLREGSRSGIGGRKERLRSTLVVVEVAGSIVLLVASGLLMRALWRVQATDPGFRAQNVLTLRSALPMPRYRSRAAREEFYTRVLGEVRQIPGVAGAAYTSFLPIVLRGGVWPVEIAGRLQDGANRLNASLRFVTPGYFATMRIPLRLGRDVSDQDRFDKPFVAVVSASFVRRYFPDENPIGRHFEFGNHDRAIVGVVGDVRVRGLEQESEPQVYLSYYQHDQVSTWYAPKDLVVRSTLPTETLANTLRRIIHQVNPEQSVSDLQTLTEVVEAQTLSRAVQLRVLGAFALVSFLLAAIGIHGLLAFNVSSRLQEIGVRMALGAKSGDIAGMILRQGAGLAAVGIVVGVALAYGAGVLLRSLLSGVEPGDGPTMLAAVGLSALMTIGSGAIPAWRAARVDPTTAIRAE